MTRTYAGAGLLACLFAFLFAACSTPGQKFEPELSYEPDKESLRIMDSAFPALSSDEASSEWGRELKIGIAFAEDLDFYRAITTFKRALVLTPESKQGRRLQTHYHIIQSYYLGRKYEEALVAFEESPLVRVSKNFPAHHDLMIILDDCYRKTEQEDKALRVMKAAEKTHPDTAHSMNLSWALRHGELDDIPKFAVGHPAQEDVESTLRSYEAQRKSPGRAKFLNTVLPGAGYYYVGQRKAAATSFLINALFIYATYQFFDRGYTAAGLITLSLEGGWYFGGINGASIAATEYNEDLYTGLTRNLMTREKLFPLLMFRFSF